MNATLRMLSGGDLRSEGRAAEVAALVIGEPERLPSLAAGLSFDDKLIRARTCMSLEVLSRTHPEIVQPLAPELVRTAEQETVAQARWHLAEIFCNIVFDARQTERAVSILLNDLGDRSKIVTYCAVQALGVIGRHSTRRSEIASVVKRRAKDGKSMAKAVARALESLQLVDGDGDPTA